MLFEKRSRWSSQAAYILAAIGCAAGLGNFWRFPILAFEYGGAAFIVALIIANILIAYPLLLTETMIGQKYQASAPQSFEKIRKNSSWIQWMAIFGITGILAYYVPVMAWATKYLFASLTGDFLADPKNYFVNEVLHLTDSVTVLGSFQWPLFAATVAGLAITAFALRKGVQSLSPIIKVTATLPFIFLAIMIVRGITLPGAHEGLAAFLIPDWSQLANIKLWQAAISQAFFSVGVAMGYFIVAASHRDKDAEVPLSSLWILGGNFAVSFLSGLAVFSIIGFMAHSQGLPLAEATTGGPMLVFSVFPTAIAMMPAGKVFFAVLLFLTMIALAIDSIFGLAEAISGAWNELRKKPAIHHTIMVLCAVLALLSVPYLFGAGLYHLDITDHFIVSYIPLLVAALEVLVILKVIGARKVREMINDTSKKLRIPSLFNYILYALPIVLLILTGINLKSEIDAPYEGYPMEYIAYFGFLPLAVIIIGAFWANYHTTD